MNFPYPAAETDYTVSWPGTSAVIVNNVEYQLATSSKPLLEKKAGKISTCLADSGVLVGDYVYYIFVYYLKKGLPDFFKKAPSSSYSCIMRFSMTTATPEILLFPPDDEESCTATEFVFLDDNRMLAKAKSSVYLYDFSTGSVIKEAFFTAGAGLYMDREEHYFSGVDENGDLIYMRPEGNAFVKTNFGQVQPKGWKDRLIFRNNYNYYRTYSTKVVDDLFYYRFGGYMQDDAANFDEDLLAEAVFSISKSKMLFSRTSSQKDVKNPYAITPDVPPGSTRANIEEKKQTILYHGQEYSVPENPNKSGLQLIDDHGQVCYELTLDHCKEISPSYVQCAKSLGEAKYFFQKDEIYYPPFYGVFEKDDRIFVIFVKGRTSDLNHTIYVLFEWRPEEEKLLFIMPIDYYCYNISALQINKG